MGLYDMIIVCKSRHWISVYRNQKLYLKTIDTALRKNTLKFKKFVNENVTFKKIQEVAFNAFI